MKVLAVNPVEDCLDGSWRKEIILDDQITVTFIHYLGKKGVLNYFPHFPRPFFRVTGEGFTLKGIQDNSYLELVVFTQDQETRLIQYINHFAAHSGAVGLSSGATP